MKWWTNTLALLAGLLAGVVACDDGAADTTGGDACYDPCVAKGGSEAECAKFCGGAGKAPPDPGAALPSLPADGSPGTYAVSFEHDGLTREAIVYAPESIARGEAAPLVLNFHGFGGSARDHMAGADMRPQADADAFLLVYPQGSSLEGSAHWNSAAPSADNKSDADDFGYVEKLIDVVAASYAVDDDRVYAVGYSNGGMMAFGLACYRGERIAAIASVAGAMLDDIGVACTPAHATSVITLHGTADSVLPYAGGDGARSAEEAVAYWTGFNEISAEATTESFGGEPAVDAFVYPGGRSGTEVRHYRVVGGGHEWFELAVDGADTGQLVWAFLSRFGRGGAL